MRNEKSLNHVTSSSPNKLGKQNLLRINENKTIPFTIKIKGLRNKWFQKLNIFLREFSFFNLLKNTFILANIGHQLVRV